MTKLRDIISELGFGEINEAGLSRLLSRIKGRDFCIATAFRSSNTMKQNRDHNRELLKILKPHKMGGYMLIGHWQEAPDGVDWEDAEPEQLTNSEEESVLFIKPDSMDRDEFISICTDIGAEFKQDAVLIGLDGDGVYLYFGNGNREKVGTGLVLNKIGQAYSQMRNKKDVPFVFEGTFQPTGNFGKQLCSIRNILY